MRDQDDGRRTRGNRRRRMTDMQHEAATAHQCAVQPARAHTEMMRHHHRHRSRGGDAVDVVDRQTGIAEGVVRGLGVQIQHRNVRKDTEVHRLRGADDRDPAAVHTRHPVSTSRNTGTS